MRVGDILKSYIPPTPEQEFREIGLRAIRSQIYQSKEYIKQAYADIEQAKKVIELHTREVARLENILEQVEGKATE